MTNRQMSPTYLPTLYRQLIDITYQETMRAVCRHVFWTAPCQTTAAVLTTCPSWSTQIVCAEIQPYTPTVTAFIEQSNDTITRQSIPLCHSTFKTFKDLQK